MLRRFFRIASALSMCEGHVVRPGKFPFRDGMQLSDVLRSYQDLLPEPAAKGDLDAPGCPRLSSGDDSVRCGRRPHRQ